MDEVVCERHGTTPARIVCRHVRDGIACGWNVDDIVALCDRCITLPKLDEEPAVVCTECWDACRQRNEVVPPYVRDGRAVLEVAARTQLAARQDLAHAQWGIDLAVPPPWSFDLEASTLTFGAIVANTRLLGCYSTTLDTFQPTWVTMGERAAHALPSMRLRPFGEVRGIPEFVQMTTRGTLDQIWDLVAIAGYVLGGDAAFRMPQDHLIWLVLLDQLRHA